MNPNPGCSKDGASCERDELTPATFNADLQPLLFYETGLLMTLSSFLGSCGAVVRGLLHTHTVDSSIAPMANPAIHPSRFCGMLPGSLE
ncbi:hypothetical protein Y032_0031g2388 [Ancylostoma ceylanicum]|uniref:Uncharacterized protein n=1 Tax=Ancylostoma ceylanicum TaxID=53326 RepID=A0A016US28_9BILA|nr:hypothetical protein Y032_0031g2388 [Ancylostoma ceylanicum]